MSNPGVRAGRWLLEQRSQCKLPCCVERGGGSGHVVLWMRQRRSGYLGTKSSECTGGHIGPL